MLFLKYLVVRSLTWALECDRPQRRRSVLLQVLEVDRDEGQRLKRRTRRSKFDEASFNVLVNRQDQKSSQIWLFYFQPQSNQMKVYQLKPHLFSLEV